ncbi:MAG: beta-ketoacyl-ACP synthase III [Desulfobacterales bacterium]|jgi:3-oxoacyl-[acyl-carrier-protein] synthase-3|nr:beta-ketoacyl-ACP synthase III [Desulfobacterales bacterium]
MRAIISAVGHYAPEKRLTNQELEEMVETSDEWITTRSGIKERRILAAGKGTSFMAVKAARAVLSQRGVDADEIDMILVATVTADMMFPATAALVQKKLKATRCWGFDVGAGCSGFLCALSTGAQFIETGKYKKVLVIGADKMSAILNYEDRNSCVLFGDGAGAVLLEPGPSDAPGIEDFLMRMDGEGGKYLYMPAGGSLHPATMETVQDKMHFLVQDGKPVFKAAVNGMVEVAVDILARSNLTAEDLDLLIPHQANLRIIEALAGRLKMPLEKIMVNIEKYGNTTAATIPMAMSEAHGAGRLKKGNRVLLAAFGTGFIWGSMLLTWAMD